MSITAVGENWQDAVNEDQSPMHILTPLTVTVDVYKCIIANTNLPKYIYNITLTYQMPTYHYTAR